MNTIAELCRIINLIENLDRLDRNLPQFATGVRKDVSRELRVNRQRVKTLLDKLS